MPIPPDSPLRVALFTDSFHEANGVATFSRHFAQFAEAHNFAFLVIRGGTQTILSRGGSLSTLELKRGFASFPLDKTLYCDPFITRHKQTVLDLLREFKPDLIHVTGPGDLGFLGLWVSHILSIPRVASWHTNLHEYLSRRLSRLMGFTPRRWRDSAARAIEEQSLGALLRFYRGFRFILAPNQTMVDLLHARTGRLAFLMAHGVDLETYTPASVNKTNRPFCIGYVGRLTTEKNVRYLAALEEKLLLAGEQNFRLLIVGEGGQQNWLRKNLTKAELTGVLRGKELVAAYLSMDVLVFPSRTDTFGLVTLEAMACGVPVITTPAAGIRVGIEDGVSGFLSDDFATPVLRLMHDGLLRRHMSEAARELAERNGWQHVFEKLYCTYAEGLAAAGLRQSNETCVNALS